MVANICIKKEGFSLPWTVSDPSSDSLVQVLPFLEVQSKGEEEEGSTTSTKSLKDLDLCHMNTGTICCCDTRQVI